MPFWIVRPIMWTLLRIAFFIFGGIHFEGREHVPLTGGVMVTPNHISDCDPTAIGVALPRACYVMAKEELFEMKYIGTLIRWLHGFPVKRYTADRAALRYAGELLEKGECVVMFPEGRLSETGQLQPILPGALLIAERAKVSIVPTIIIGTDVVMPYGKTKPRWIRHKMIVRFGPPVTVAELTGGQKGGEALKRGAERLGVLMRAVQENKPYPPADPPPPRRNAKAAAETSPQEPNAPTVEPELKLVTSAGLEPEPSISADNARKAAEQEVADVLTPPATEPTEFGV